jgi:hypothetical protein
VLVELVFGKQPSQSYDMNETLEQLSQVLNSNNKNNEQEKSFFHLIKQCLSQVLPSFLFLKKKNLFVKTKTKNFSFISFFDIYFFFLFFFI